MCSNRVLCRVLVLCALSLPLAPVASQAMDFSVFGSYWKTDDFDDGWGGGARLSWGDRLQLQVTGAYYDKLELNSPAASLPEIDPLTIEVSPIPVDLGIVYFFRRDSQGLYGGAGGSYYFLEANGLDLQDEWGYFLQIGFLMRKLFIEVVYRDVKGQIENFEDLPIDLGGASELDLSGYNINVGWRF